MNIDRGIVYSCGDNKMGQCGINNGPPVITSPMLVSHYCINFCF